MIDMKKIYSFFILALLICKICVGQTASIDHWETIILSNQIWKYFIGNTEPDADWRKLTFIDSTWLSGEGGIGYGDGDDRTIIEPTISLYLRMKFTIYDLAKIERAILHVDYDDAFVAYINDFEIARANIGISGDHPSHDQLSDTDHEAQMYQGGNPEGFLIEKQNLANCLSQGENVLAIQVHNSDPESSDLSSITFFSVGINDTSIMYYQTPSWFGTPEDLSSNLPIVVIDTNGQLIPDEPRIVAEMGIIYNEPEKRNTITDEYNHYNGRINIELRGNSSLEFPKKSYALETQKSNGDNNNVSLLDMPRENDWILYGPYSDKSLMRNVLTFKLARDIGQYAPRTRFCELILNGDYQGIYVLMKKIKQDKNRVDIAKLTPADTNGDDLTGGYILKLDWEDPKSQGRHSPIDGKLFHYHHPQKENLLAVQKRYIKDWIIHFERILSSDDYLDDVIGYRRYINMDSFVDYFISAQLAHNADCFRLSTFMYKDRNSRDSTLHFGPLWDFDLAYGNQDEGPYGTPYGWVFEYDLDEINFWWDRFLSDSVFTDRIKKRWHELRQNVLSQDRILAYIDSVALALDEAQQRNFDRWKILGEWVWPNAYIGEDYQDEVDYLKDFIVKRLEWLDAKIPDLGKEKSTPRPQEEKKTSL